MILWASCTCKKWQQLTMLTKTQNWPTYSLAKFTVEMVRRFKAKSQHLPSPSNINIGPFFCILYIYIYILHVAHDNVSSSKLKHDDMISWWCFFPLEMSRCTTALWIMVYYVLWLCVCWLSLSVCCTFGRKLVCWYLPIPTKMGWNCVGLSGVWGPNCWLLTLPSVANMLPRPVANIRS